MAVGIRPSAPPTLPIPDTLIGNIAIDTQLPSGLNRGPAGGDSISLSVVGSTNGDASVRANGTYTFDPNPGSQWPGQPDLSGQQRVWAMPMGPNQFYGWRRYLVCRQCGLRAVRDVRVRSFATLAAAVAESAIDGWAILSGQRQALRTSGGVTPCRLISF